MLVIDDLSVRVAGRLLIEGACVQVPTGARVGLVGRNGTGKTTLFRVLTGEFSAEHGKIEVGQRTRIGRLSQEAPGGPQTLLETVLAADTERSALLAEAETATDSNRIAEIHTRLADIDAHAAPARAAAILAGLGFDAAAQSRACSEFSGGWRMRVALAAMLFAQPDLLLLDEPTNYLDLEGTLWLQDHLAHYPYGVIVISHDRDLLDNAVDHILHLENGRLTLYRGGYSAFDRQRRARLELDAKAAKKRQTERSKIEAFVERFRAKASKARQAQSRLKLLAKLEPIAVAGVDEVRPIEFPPPERKLSPPILAIDDVAVGYTPGVPVLQGLTLRIDADDRIALLGTNGNGKSTLAKLLAGRLSPFEGKIVRPEKLLTAYFAQHQLDELRAKESPFDHIRRLMPDVPEAKVRARAGAIGFSGQAANAAVKTLSGGEKARLLLGLATFHGPHLTILDEPTNHLDIDSRSALIEAINAYEGAVILVSHDRYLLDACAERLWLVAGGTVGPFDGDLDDYRRLILSGEIDSFRPDQRHEPGAKQPKASRSEMRRSAAEKRAELAPLREQVISAEKDMARFSAEIARIDAELSGADVFARDPGKAASLAKARAVAHEALVRAEECWLEASAAYEQSMN
ncbi:MAG TPA: ABC-F family ATP-binding cassette domain-containing protein [Xanthobacteraceae bacterium]|jgi:ATP-binding cassette subfamily F protein 3|nr:ABC-F family ATP-binding cassette domain-containing protein [Xanthobacteraceae bacterium]